MGAERDVVFWYVPRRAHRGQVVVVEFGPLIDELLVVNEEKLVAQSMMGASLAPHW